MHRAFFFHRFWEYSRPHLLTWCTVWCHSWHRCLSYTRTGSRNVLSSASNNHTFYTKFLSKFYSKQRITAMRVLELAKRDALHTCIIGVSLSLLISCKKIKSSFSKLKTVHVLLTVSNRAVYTVYANIECTYYQSQNFNVDSNWRISSPWDCDLHRYYGAAPTGTELMWLWCCSSGSHDVYLMSL